MNNNIDKAKGSKRLTYVSLLRVVAMVSVVYYHSFCYYGIWMGGAKEISFYKQFDVFLISLSMPEFVFLSGFLYSYLRVNCHKYLDTKTFVVKKAKRLLIPYCFWGVLLVLLARSGSHTWSAFFSGICHLWFLLMLFEEFIFFHLSFRLWNQRNFYTNACLVIALFCVSSFICNILRDNGYSIAPLGPMAFFQYLPIYALGMFVSCNIEKFYTIKKYSTPLTIVLMLFLFLNEMQIVTISKNNSWIIYCIIITSLISMKSFTERHCIKGNWLLDLDKCSMGIYIIHHPILEGLVHVRKFQVYLDEYFYILPFVMFVCVFALSWILTHYILKSRFRILLG